MNRPKMWRAALAGVLLAAIPAVACRIIPVPPPWPPPWPHPPGPPPPAPVLRPMETTAHQAEIKIDGAVARVEVAATFRNPNPTRIEGTYFFPIEPDAVVQDFSLTVNGKELKAELLDADKARQQYEDIVRRLKDPALLEFVGTRMLKARIFPIEPGAEVKVALHYSQIVRADAGLYHFRYPLRSARPDAGAIGRLSLRATVRAETPVRLFYSPTHKIDTVRHGDQEASGGFEAKDTTPDRDFDLYWTLDDADVDVSVAAYKPRNEDGFFLLALAPKLHVEPGRVEPKDIVFAFDKSGSMSGDKIRQAKDALTYCLERLNPADRFAVLAFGTDVDPLTDGLAKVTPESVRAAKEKVAALDARGGTAIYDALGAAAGLVADDRERLAMIVFLTDGRPTVGETDTDAILAAVKKANTGAARLFVFGVGYDLNADLLDRLATANGGTQQYVGEQEDLEVKVSSFYDKIAQPVLSDVRVETEGVELRDVYPHTAPDVFAGGQVLLFGRYRGAGSAKVTVRGRARGKEETFGCAADFGGSDRNDFLPPLWAHRKVAFLLEQLRLHGKDKELVDEVTALGKQYGILTPYTSFLAAEDETPERRARVDALRQSFEGNFSGRSGVALSRGMAEAKAADAAMPAGAPAVMGMNWGPAGGGGASPAAPEVSSFVERVKHTGDKVFYRQSDGLYYDSTFDEATGAEPEVVHRFSDAYFALLGRHPGIGRYLAAGLDMVLCIDGKTYRIVE